jgi:nitrate reductase NapAB chaperone NapD
MPIKSYIAHPAEDKRNELIMKLREFSFCNIMPASNQEIVIVVTDTFSNEEDQVLYEKLLNLPELKHLTLVSGFSDEEIIN